MLDINFSDYMCKHVHFSKVEENTWLVQSNPESRCEAFYVTVLPNAIVMYGDYDGVIVKPHEAGKENLISWMANATTLSYFVEKVHNGNQHHQCMEFDKDTCNDTILKNFMDRFELDSELKQFFKNSMNNCLSYNNIESEFDSKLARILGCHEDNLKETYNRKYQCMYRFYSEVNFDNMIKMLDDVLSASFENEWELAEWMNQHEFYDIDKYDYMCYTHQIKWQHECLLWWARHVVDEVLKAHGEKLLKQVDTIVAHHGEVKVMSEMNYNKGKSDERANIKDFIVMNAVISGKDERIDINLSKDDYKKLMGEQ